MFEWCSMVLAMTLIWSLGQQNTWLTGLNVCKSSAAANSVSINRYLSSQLGGGEGVNIPNLIARSWKDELCCGGGLYRYLWLVSAGVSTNMQHC